MLVLVISQSSNNMENKKIVQYLKGIRSKMGAHCIHENYGSFNFYSDDDYVVIKGVMGKYKGVEISCHRLFTDREIQLSFYITEKIPTAIDIMGFLRQARIVITMEKQSESDKLERIEELKEELETLESDC